MRLYLCGGFLGAGKTTAIRALARRLRDDGETVAIVSNDQGQTLVDTQLLGADGSTVYEVGSGCFCCRFDALEQAILHAREAGATVVVAEAVGSCTDLVATVISPLAARLGGSLQLAPLVVFVDPFRAAEVAAGKYPDQIGYLFRKQVEEADIIALTRADLPTPDVLPFLRTITTAAPVIAISCVDGRGLEQLLTTLPTQLAQPLAIDYDRYAAAEAMLGWANGRVVLTAESAFDPRSVLQRFFRELSSLPVMHLKVFVDEPTTASAQLTHAGASPQVDFERLPQTVRRLALVVNARVAIAPELLEERLRSELEHAVDDGVVVAWQQLTSIAPGRPTPAHRYTTRCAADDASCCASFYGRADVRYLLGDSFHPGGTELTLRLADELGLTEDSELLDVACGMGASIAAIRERIAVRASAMDVSTTNAAWLADVYFRLGDAHRIPFEAGQFDAVLCECALSTFYEQPRALSEIWRVLRPGGRLAVSDMVVNGCVPEALADWVHVGTCLSHARSLDDYAALLTQLGFRVVKRVDTVEALQSLLRQIKRRLLGAALAKSSGMLATEITFDLTRGRNALKEAQRALDDKLISYGYLIAEKPETR